MTSRITALAARREALVGRARARRNEVGMLGEQLRGELAGIDTFLGAARAVQRSGIVIGAAVAILAVIGPSRLLRVFPKAMRFAPLVLNVYRAVRARRAHRV